MIRATLLALLSHWRRHPGQALTLILGLALATALWTAVQAINAEARASYAAANAVIAPQQTSTLTAATGKIPTQTYVALRRAGWQVSPVIEGRLSVGGARVTLLGVDLLTYPALPIPDRPQETENPADLLLAPGRLFAAPETARRITRPDLPPVVEAANVPAGLVITDIGLALPLLESDGVLTRLLVAPDQALGLPPLSEIAPDLRLEAPRTQPETEGLTRSFHLNLTAFGFLSFAVGLFIVHGTIGLAFEQRRGIIRTLRALGVPGQTLGRAMFAELLATGSLAGLLGIAIGYLLAAALLPGVAATLGGLYGAEVAGSLSLRASWVIAGLAMAVGGVLIAGAQVLWRARRLPVLALAGAEAWRHASAHGLRWQFVAGLALMACAALVVWLFDGLVAGFLCQGCLLLGAALMLAPLVSRILDLGARTAKGPVSAWLWADLRMQLPGLSLALMALMLALATNIGVGTMVSSFRLTFTDWLDQRLGADLYITTTDAAQTEALQAWLAARATTVVPVRATDLRLADRPGRVYGIIDDPFYRETWPMVAETPGLWDALAEGKGVIINEQLHYGAGLDLGDPLSLLPGWSLPVVGIYADYGNPNAQAITGLDALLAYVPELPNRQLAVRGGQADMLAADLRDTFDLPATAIVPQAAVKEMSLQVFDRTFLITGALNLLTLGVAGFAILTSLLTLWTMRLPQLAPAWAMGLTRADLARLEVLRALALAALTALLALPLGLLLAWTLLAVVNVEAFGWRLPMYLFPLDWMRLFALALLAAGLAALIPALRLRRLPPADLVKVFANVR
ncbi:MAG: ABC transporter permease [Pseudomonadota bacterium]